MRRKYLKPLKVEVVGIFPPNSKISIKIEIKGKGKDWSHKAFKDTVVTRALISLHGGSL